MKVDFVYSQVSDLLFHFLAHMKVQNASDLYSENYINFMQSEKNGESSILQEASLLTSYYNDHFERLGVINFLPFYCSDLQAFRDLLLHHHAFCDEDRELFLYPLLRFLERENLFYSDYWERKFYHEQDKRLLAENYMKDTIQKYRCLFQYFKREPAVVCFSFSLTRNGRGLGNETSFSAIVPFPKDSTDYFNCFFQLLHEYTHQFTDALIGSSIQMSDGSHDLSEKLVILFDYYLIKALNKADIEAYLAWLAKIGENEAVSELEFLSFFKIPEALNNTLLSLVEEIIRC